MTQEKEKKTGDSFSWGMNLIYVSKRQFPTDNMESSVEVRIRNMQKSVSLLCFSSWNLSFSGCHFIKRVFVITELSFKKKRRQNMIDWDDQ